MGHALAIINSVRDQIAETLEHLAEARKRRDVVRAAGESFPGARRSARTGSLPTGYVNAIVDDADSALVLDRRTYPKLGPDGDGELPTEIIEQIQAHVGPIVRETYPNAAVYQMKRGIVVRCHEKVDDIDPTVDMVIALARADEPGLWIPNTDAGRWDPSHPERHVELFTSGTAGLRRIRAQATRVVKAWNKQYSEPALSSFNIAALGWEAITETMPLDDAVATLLEHGVTSLTKRRTDDPAEVSGPIKLLKPKSIVLNRLTDAATKVRTAIESADVNEVTELLASVFWKYVDAPAGGDAALVKGLRAGNKGLGVSNGLLVAGAGAGLRTARSFGGRRG